MFRILGALSVLVLVIGLAIAQPNEKSETTGNPGFGNQLCIGVAEWKNPGKAIQWVRHEFGANPKQFVDHVNHHYAGIYPYFKNLGEFLDFFCGPSASASY